MRLPRRPVTIVIVEDSLPLRQAFRGAFEDIPGVRIVGEAEDAATALRHLRDLRPDVVTLDLKLKRDYGTDLLRRLREADFPVKPLTIVLTNHVEPFVRAACLDLGADHFFDKANEFGEACAAIAQLAAQRQRSERSHG